MPLKLSLKVAKVVSITAAMRKKYATVPPQVPFVKMRDSLVDRLLIAVYAPA